MVDSKGIEPSTLRMRTVRSPRLSYEPKYRLLRRAAAASQAADPHSYIIIATFS